MESRLAASADCIRAAICLVAALLVAGCATGDPDVFYRLAPDGPVPEGKVSSAEIGVGPVELPDYVDRNELVFQSSPNRFEIPANHLWAGSLQDNIASVLTTNLARRLKPRGVVSYPFASGVRPPVRIAVQIHRFHAHTGEDAVLEATWFITGLKENFVPVADPGENAGGETGVPDSEVDNGPEWESDVFTRSATFRQDLLEDGYEGVVAAESELLSRLAAAIATDL